MLIFRNTQCSSNSLFHHTDLVSNESLAPQDRTIAVTRFQTDLCSLLNGSLEASVLFYLTNRNLVTHCVIPASVAGTNSYEFISAIREKFLFEKIFTSP